MLVYDPTTERAKVQPVLRVRFVDLDAEELVTELPPPLANRPVLWAAAGMFGIDGELGAGDDVVLLVSNRSIAEWMAQSSPDITPADLRRFDLSDALVLPVRARVGTSRHVAGSVFLGARTEGGAGLHVTQGTVALGTPSVELLARVVEGLEACENVAAVVATPPPGGAATPVTAGSLQPALAELNVVNLTTFHAQLTDARRHRLHPGQPLIARARSAERWTCDSPLACSSTRVQLQALGARAKCENPHTWARPRIPGRPSLKPDRYVRFDPEARARVQAGDACEELTVIHALPRPAPAPCRGAG